MKYVFNLFSEFHFGFIRYEHVTCSFGDGRISPRSSISMIKHVCFWNNFKWIRFALLGDAIVRLFSAGPLSFCPPPTSAMKLHGRQTGCRRGRWGHGWIVPAAGPAASTALPRSPPDLGAYI